MTQGNNGLDVQFPMNLLPYQLGGPVPIHAHQQLFAELRVAMPQLIGPNMIVEVMRRHFGDSIETIRKANVQEAIP